ncbi:MAG: ATP-binding protein [Bacteroidales bacterium]
MAIREIIQIDEELCDGCGECVPSCVEGALRVVNGKARLVSDVLCDGLGACLGHCPTGALKVISRAAPDFDEVAATAHATSHRPIAARPARTIAVAAHSHAGGGCPGSRVQNFADDASRPAAPARHPANLGFIGLKSQMPTTPLDRPAPATAEPGRTDLAGRGSKLRQWPVQLHLLPPTAPFFRDRHVLLAADCVPVAVGDFHESFLDGRSLAIACPKLDQHQDVYVDKLAAMIDEGGILSLTVAIMEVPCCGGLVRLAQAALERADRKVPLTVERLSIRGERL